MPRPEIQKMTILVTAILAASVVASPFPFTSDFEAPPPSQAGVPPAPWDRFAANPDARLTIGVGEEAAHRGMRGLRVVDNSTTTSTVTSAVGQGVQAFFRERTQDFHFRSWVRVETPTAGAGSTTLVLIHAATNSANINSLLDVVFAGSTRRIVLSGPHISTTDPTQFVYTDATASRPLAPGWHLLELSILGLNSASGQRVMWLDGVEVARQQNLNFTGVGVYQLTLGYPTSDQKEFVGTASFDDVRFDELPLANRFALSIGGEGSCRPVTVAFRSASGAAAAPIEDVPFTLEAAGGLPVFSDAACSQDAGALVVSLGEAEKTVYVAAKATAVEVTATSVDYLSGTARLEAVTVSQPAEPAPPVEEEPEAPLPESPATPDDSGQRFSAVGCETASSPFSIPTLAAIAGLAALRVWHQRRRRDDDDRQP